ncbi:N-acetylmuramic acid 6-phosphate etherase [Cohnella phaseoli]|uniref:N-acetylmuramic acid 6-phosphate etherase n=1 Tax=Cohnella phaseoli TaxID=456490 RepID=A0A3D9INW3_9BACL|nr:N-acetylmuramic acid 6-phosphate etherase [Cohnella phaseoli]RED63328.1 N-acetylmuramic acid 6-phosphate etherase [Cohnella phaseoli]
MERLEHLVTEQRNARTRDLSELSIKEIIEIMNEEDQTVALAVKKELPAIERAIAAIVSSMEKQGRLVYVGAGTSGRIGVLDASECPPTFGVDFNTVIGLIAGGEGAFIKAVEGAEDDEELAVSDLKRIVLTANDVVVGLTASGRTPYAKGALQYARQAGATTVSVACNKDSLVSSYADHAIEVEVGPEILTGSTRLKAATAQKLILNMISTTAMIRLGKVYQNLMMDLHASNQKLRERSLRIVMEATGAGYEEASLAMKATDNHVKTAIVMLETGRDCEAARAALGEASGFVKRAIEVVRTASRE